jgi:hypothetical protein
VSVINDAGFLFMMIQYAVQEGINQWKYDASISSIGKEKWQKKVKDLKLKEAKNGKLYLPPGKYQVKLTQGTASQSTPLEIVKIERNQQ